MFIFTKTTIFRFNSCIPSLIVLIKNETMRYRIGNSSNGKRTIWIFCKHHSSISFFRSIIIHYQSMIIKTPKYIMWIIHPTKTIIKGKRMTVIIVCCSCNPMIWTKSILILKVRIIIVWKNCITMIIQALFQSDTIYLCFCRKLILRWVTTKV